VYSGLVGVLATPIDAGNVATAASFDAVTTVAVMPVETAEPGSLADVTSDLDGAAVAPTLQRSNGRLP
jgi:hypothetical protein